MVSSQSASSGEKLTKKNFGLKEEEFDRLAKNLKNGDDHLYQQVVFVHFSECRAYLKSSLKISSTEAYDATVDALLLFGEKIKQGKIRYGNLRFLFTQMAKQAYLQLQRAKKPFVELEEAGGIIERFDGPDKEMLSVLNKAWKQLGDTCQHLLKGIFYEEMQIKDIALSIGIPAPTARKQKERCMRKLQQLFKKLQ